MKSFWRLRPHEKVSRRSTRFPNFSLAKLAGKDGWMGEAYVKEISRDGARLSHDDPDSIPDVLSIDIPSERVRVDATVRWRTDRLFGVSFASPVDLPNQPSDSADRLRHLGWTR